MTERQKQALRGLRLAELALESRVQDLPDYTPGIQARHFSCGSAAFYVQGELPDRPQHGNGALDGRSWSGTVPKARYLAGAIRSLVRLGLAEELSRLLWHEHQRSGTYRLTDEGKAAADDLLSMREKANVDPSLWENYVDEAGYG